MRELALHPPGSLPAPLPAADSDTSCPPSAAAWIENQEMPMTLSDFCQKISAKIGEKDCGQKRLKAEGNARDRASERPSEEEDNE